jgi:enterochelin esterase-like enzyme
MALGFMNDLNAQNYARFQHVFTALQDSTRTEATYLELVNSGSIPFVELDSVLFLYQGSANTVTWVGDFNGWGNFKKFKNTGTKIKHTNIWYLKSSFPPDSRLDYKIVVNSTEWILDPVNPHYQWSGVGGGSPNSELRMPLWISDFNTQEKENIPKGKLAKDVLLNSKVLKYQVMYSVYTPPEYSREKVLPILYVTDGYEYLHENMGDMFTTLNKLLFEKKIKPLIVVFIDHREPVNRINNKRMNELAMNELYRQFFIDEFIPTVESEYSVSKKSQDRAILGTSMGGLTAAYFSFSRPDIFGMAGIQSPAFWFKPDIYTLCDSPESPPVKIYMTTGVIHDTEDGARKMKEILDKNTWGNWRNMVDDILIYFFPLN